MATTTLVPTAVSDPNANIASGAVTDIDNTIASANDAAFIQSVTDQWVGGTGTGSAFTFTMSDVPGNFDTVNTVQFRVRGRLENPGTGDTMTITYDVTGTNAPTTTATWDETDDGAGFANRGDASAQSSSATAANINGWQVRCYQSAYLKDKGPDALYIDISEIEIIVDYNETVGGRTMGGLAGTGGLAGPGGLAGKGGGLAG